MSATAGARRRASSMSYRRSEAVLARRAAISRLRLGDHAGRPSALVFFAFVLFAVALTALARRSAELYSELSADPHYPSCMLNPVPVHRHQRRPEDDARTFYYQLLHAPRAHRPRPLLLIWDPPIGHARATSLPIDPLVDKMVIEHARQCPVPFFSASTVRSSE